MEGKKREGESCLAGDEVRVRRHAEQRRALGAVAKQQAVVHIKSRKKDTEFRTERGEFNNGLFARDLDG